MITDQVYQDYLRQIYQYGDELETRNHRVKTDFLDTFRAFLYVCGFHADTIADLLNDDNLST